MHACAFLCREQKALSCETPTLKDLIKFVERRDGSESNPALVTSLCNKQRGFKYSEHARAGVGARIGSDVKTIQMDSDLFRYKDPNPEVTNVPQSHWMKRSLRAKQSFVRPLLAKES